MKNILVIANYKKSKGGISGQVDILLEKFNNDKFTCELFNTKLSNFKRLFLPIKLFLVRKNYDTFHIHGCSHTGFLPIIIGTIIGKLSKKRLITTYHGGNLEVFLKSYPKFVKYFLTRADILTVPSTYLYNILKKNKIKAILLPNVIREDNVTFKKREMFKPNFVVTRSLENVYNIPLVIKAFVQIKNKYPEANLYLVGSGSLKDKLQNEVLESGVKGIIFYGRIANSEIGNILNTADIYINPTTADNMPLSLFEAFACGLPVISTNVGGIPNFIQDNKNGFLINNNDQEALVEKIDYILENQDKIKPIIENGYSTFRKYTWNTLEKQYYDIHLKN